MSEPSASRRSSRGGVLQALGQIGENFERFQVSPDEMVEQGDTVVVLSHLDGKTRTGKELKLPGVEIWRMGDGKAKRVQSLVDTAEIKQALEG